MLGGGMGFFAGLALLVAAFLFWPFFVVLGLLVVAKSSAQRWFIVLGFIGLYLIGFG